MLNTEQKIQIKQNRINAILGRGTYIKFPGVLRKLKRDIRNLSK